MLHNLENYEIMWEASWASNSGNKHILIRNLMHYYPVFAGMQQSILVDINKIYPVYARMFRREYTRYPKSEVFIIPFRRLQKIYGNRNNNHLRDVNTA